MTAIVNRTLVTSRILIVLGDDIDGDKTAMPVRSLCKLAGFDAELPTAFASTMENTQTSSMCATLPALVLYQRSARPASRITSWSIHVRVHRLSGEAAAGVSRRLGKRRRPGHPFASRKPDLTCGATTAGSRWRTRHALCNSRPQFFHLRELSHPIITALETGVPPVRSRFAFKLPADAGSRLADRDGPHQALAVRAAQVNQLDSLLGICATFGGGQGHAREILHRLIEQGEFVDIRAPNRLGWTRSGRRWPLIAILPGTTPKGAVCDQADPY